MYYLLAPVCQETICGLAGCLWLKVSQKVANHWLQIQAYLRLDWGRVCYQAYSHIRTVLSSLVIAGLRGSVHWPENYLNPFSYGPLHKLYHSLASGFLQSKPASKQEHLR